MRKRHLPEYPDYLFTSDGNVYSKISKRNLGTRQDGHYVSLVLANRKTGKQDRISRHIAIATAFHGRPVPPRNVVNHKNGIPGDDRPFNLEWVTHKENLGAATSSWGDGLTKTPVSIRNAETYVVTHFNSVCEAARALEMSLDKVLYRVRQRGRRVYPDCNQYRYRDDEKPWDEPTVKQFGHNYSVLVKDIETGTVYEYASQRSAGEFLGVKDATISVWLKSGEQPLWNLRYMVKRSDDKTPWREINDPLKDGNYLIAVIAIDVAIGKVYIYPSCSSCAKERGLSVTTLSERLKTGRKDKVWKDGFRYMYY